MMGAKSKAKPESKGNKGGGVVIRYGSDAASRRQDTGQDVPGDAKLTAPLLQVDKMRLVLQLPPELRELLARARAHRVPGGPRAVVAPEHHLMPRAASLWGGPPGGRSGRGGDVAGAQLQTKILLRNQCGVVQEIYM